MTQDSSPTRQNFVTWFGRTLLLAALCSCGSGGADTGALPPPEASGGTGNTAAGNLPDMGAAKAAGTDRDIPFQLFPPADGGPATETHNLVADLTRSASAAIGEAGPVNAVQTGTSFTGEPPGPNTPASGGSAPFEIIRSLSAGPGPTPTTYPVSADGKYYYVNLLRRNYPPPTASATFANGAALASSPQYVFDGDDTSFIWTTPSASDPDATVTLTVDMGRYFSIGAVRPLYYFTGQYNPISQSVRVATTPGTWTTVVPLAAVPSNDTTLSFDATPARYLELTMVGTRAAASVNLPELFVYPSAQTSPPPTSASGYDLGYLSTSSVNDNAFAPGVQFPMSWPAGDFLAKKLTQGATGDAVGTVDLGAQFTVSRLSLCYAGSGWANGGRLEVAAIPDTYSAVSDSGIGHPFGTAVGQCNEYALPTQPVRYVRATDYFISGLGPSDGILWSVQAFTSPAPQVAYYPLGDDGKYFKVNLLRRPPSVTQPTASVVYANGAAPFPDPSYENPAGVFDGDDFPFRWSAPGLASDPNPQVTLTIDLGQVLSIGAIHPVFNNPVPLRYSLRTAQTLGAWTQAVADTPIPAPEFTASFDATPARYLELTMRGTLAFGLVDFQELLVFPSATTDPAPSSASQNDLTYLTGTAISVNANMALQSYAQARIQQLFGHGKSIAQGATGDGVITVDLGQQYQLSQIGLAFYQFDTWPGGGKVEVDDGSGTLSTVFDSGRGTMLGSPAGGLLVYPFSSRAVRYIRVTDYFVPGVGTSFGRLMNYEVFPPVCAPNCANKNCGDDLSDGCGGTCAPVCQPGQAGCVSSFDCQAGTSCEGRTPGSPIPNVCVAPTCLSNPSALGCGFPGAPCGPSCTPVHCSNGVRDGDETDVDCGGTCEACPTGSGCVADTDCGPDQVCGESNGACFGHARAQRVCWKATCELGSDVGGCGDLSSPCGQNCACVNGCDATNPLTSCPSGEVCKAGLGTIFGAPTSAVCLDPRCPSNDPALCGSGDSVCGAQCVCTADCSTATCQHPGDGCGGVCPGVCTDGQTGCDHDVTCPTGDVCLPDASGIATCRPRACAFRILTPPLCGSSGALCGDTCPACTPSCDNRQCGVDPNCGQSCGTCGASSFCDFNGQCVTPTANPPITVPDGNGGQKPLPDLPPSPTTPVGALKGQFSVSEQGTSQYTIPIEVPPGRAGMEPALSLTYAGSRVNENQGVGWHLEGLSKITRCPRSFALDRYSAPVKNDTSDRFCIDGKRLESVSGDYGADGTEYRTLIDSFAKVVSHVDPGSGLQLALWAGVNMTPRSQQGPDYFQVFTRDGRILTFGRSQDSLVMARNGTRFAWLLNRVEDRAHNTMFVGYENLFANISAELKAGFPNAVRPSLISYTGHGDSAGNRTVRFSYETRSDPQVTFLQGGVPFFAPDRLSRLTTYVNSVPVKNYKLQYGSGALSQIEKIFECVGGDDAVCKAPTTFEYTQESGFTSFNPGSFATDLAAAGELDANGDGIPDFLVTTVHVGDVDAKPALAVAEVSTDVAIEVASQALSPVGALAVNVIWNFIQGPFWGLFGSDPTVTITHQMRLGTGQRNNPIQFVDNVNGIHCDTSPTFVLDYDQDGKDDVISACGTHNGSIFVAQSLGNGQFGNFPTDKAVLTAAIGPLPVQGARGGGQGVAATEPAPIFSDIDGDGLQDVVTCEDPYTLDLWRRLPPALGSERQPFTQGFAAALQLHAPPQQPPQKGAPPPPARSKLALCDKTRPTFHVFDVDGDGAPDLLVRGPDGWVTLRYVITSGTASLSFQPVSFPDVGGDQGSSGGSLSLADFNGDGLADVWHARGDDKQVVVWINAGGGLFYARTVDRPRPAFDADPRYQYRRTAVLDYNADGRSDLLENWQFVEDFGGELFSHNSNTALLPDSILSLFAAQDAPELKHPSIGAGVVPSSFDVSADIDGDGNRDIFGDGGELFYGSGARNTLLKHVVDGLGNEIHVAYSSDGAACTGPSCTYQHDTCVANWPEKCLPVVSGLVSSHTEGFMLPNGDHVTERNYTYHYSNAHLSLTGHGWLGFDRRTVDMVGTNTNVSSTTTIDYEPVARYDLTGQPTQSTTPPYLYPLAGLPNTTTVDQHVASGAGCTILPCTTQPPLQNGFYDRRTQSINTWGVSLSASKRPFPSVFNRDVSTYDRPLNSDGSRPSFDDNGVLLTECFETFNVDFYGNQFEDDKRCQAIGEVALEETVTSTTFTPDAASWLISNPENIQISSDRGTFANREFGLTYTPDGLLRTVTRAPKGTGDQRLTTTYDRDDFGNVKQITEAGVSGPARITGITYDGDSVFPRTITNAEGQPTTVEFDPNWGQPTKVVDANGIVVQMSYDGFGKRTLTSGPEGQSVSTYATIAASFAFSAVGAILPRVQVNVQLQGTEATPGGSSTTEYDNYGRVVRTTSDGFGGSKIIQEQAYDSVGRSLGRTLPHTAGLSTVPFDQYSYDELQRVTRVTHSDGSFKEYQYASSASLDPSHAQWLNGMTCDFGLPLSFCAVGFTQTIDEEGRKNAVVTDYQGRVVRNVDGENLDSGAHSSNYVYGPFNQLAEARDNRNLLTGFHYDDYGRLLTQTDPDTDPSTYTYNGFDELESSLEPLKQLRTYHHDVLGRMDSVLDGDGTTQWIYDQGVNGLGRITESISPATPESPAGQHIHYSYEPPTAAGNRGLVQTVTYTIDGTDYPINLEYDDLGRTSRIHYPSQPGGAPIVAQYQYDSSGVLNGLDEVGSGTAKTLWRINDVFEGHLIQDETFGNGAKTTYGYEPNRRWLANIQTTLGKEQIQSLEYTHFNNGRVQSLNAAGGVPVEYQYDNLNRLSSVSTLSDVPTGTLYTYDDIGNLIGHGATVNSYFNKGPHLVQQVGDNSYLYDRNGNVSFRGGPDVPGGSQVLQYTPFNLPRLIATATSDTTQRSTQFDYSADEERLVRRDVDSSTLHFVSDLYQRKFDTFDTTLEERFRLYAGDRQLGEIVRKDGTDKTLFFHTDHLGSTDTISDSTGASTTQRFDPFGAPLSPPNPEITRVGFTGQDQDVDLGFTDMKGRMYDPLAGRFASADPVMQAPFWSQGLNRYSYAFNDPINNTDPSGFESTALWVGFTAFTAGDLALLCYGTGACGGLGGVLDLSINLGTTGLSGFPGAAGSRGFSYAGVAPTAAPTSTGVSRGSSQAVGQNKGGVGLPRYQGGGSGVSNGEGGNEGTDSTNSPTAENVGAYLVQSSPGVFRLSPSGQERIGGIFKSLGYNLGNARIRFRPLDEGTHAYTEGDLITLDPGRWSSSLPYRQARLLTHELTHSVQFQRLGYWTVRIRETVEDYRYGLDSYMVPGPLHRIPLSQLNVGDSRFTLEAIAEHVATQLKP